MKKDKKKIATIFGIYFRLILFIFGAGLMTIAVFALLQVIYEGDIDFIDILAFVVIPPIALYSIFLSIFSGKISVDFAKKEIYFSHFIFSKIPFSHVRNFEILKLTGTTRVLGGTGIVQINLCNFIENGYKKGKKEVLCFNNYELMLKAIEKLNNILIKQ